MFVAGEAQAEISFSRAQVVLADLARAGWLLDAARGAYGTGPADAGQAGLPDPPRGMSWLVTMYFQDLVARGDSAYLAFRWEAAGPGGELFPALDADLTLRPSGDHATTLALAGVYRLPPEDLGHELDRAVVRRVAAATIQAFLDRITEAMTVPAPARNGGASTGSWPPAAEAP